MSWLSKILNYVPVNEREGLSFGKEPLWLISCCKDFPAFLRTLSDIFPYDSVLYIEGGKPPKDIQSYLEARKSTHITKVAMGTIWPYPQYFHIPITSDNSNGLAQLAEKHHIFEIAAHIHIYNNDRMLLQWYDAFTDPLYISKDIPEEKIKQFCSALGLKYEATQGQK